MAGSQWGQEEASRWYRRRFWRSGIRSYQKQHASDRMVTVTLSSGERITCTDQHPFFVPGKGWTPAGQLALGTLIAPRAGPMLAETVMGQVRVTRVEWKPVAAGTTVTTATTTVYNFEVEGTHTYFVGNCNGGTWVHNDSFTLALGTTEGVGGGNPLEELINSLWAANKAKGSRAYVTSLTVPWSEEQLALKAGQAESIHFTTQSMVNWGPFTENEMEWIMTHPEVWHKTYIH